MGHLFRNVDKSNFSPLVGISPLSASESVPLSLLAVSGNGVRYYFSTCSRQTNNPMDRPMGNLVLQHVRLPPGFSASSPVPKPSKVHMSYYRQGTQDNL
jgi:nuclear pore complex protein Nup155